MGQKSVQSLERALAILTLLCDRDQPAGVTELAGRLRLAKSTVHRLLSTLEQAGVVARTGDAAYRPGLKLWEIGCAAVRGLNVRDAARPAMERLMRRTGETVHLSVWDQGEVVYIEKVDGTNPIRLHSTIGGRAPAHATASGLAFLAFGKPEETTEVWKKGGGDEPLKSNEENSREKGPRSRSLTIQGAMGSGHLLGSCSPWRPQVPRAHVAQAGRDTPHHHGTSL